MSTKIPPVMSAGAAAALAVNRIQCRINGFLDEDVDLLAKDIRGPVDALIAQRTAAEEVLRNLDMSATDDAGTGLLDEPMSLSTVPVTESGTRYGCGNQGGAAEKVIGALIAEMDTVSEEWISRCSSAEVAAVLAYTSDSKEYAATVANKEQQTEILHSALSKAPKLTETHVYSGASTHTRECILDQLNAGATEIVLERALSTSVNPAQVNGFMSSWKHNGTAMPDEAPTMALEIVTDTGAVMTMVSHSRQELEILVPPSRYEVIGEEADVLYSWETKESGKEPFGRVANRVIKLRRIGDA